MPVVFILSATFFNHFFLPSLFSSFDRPVLGGPEISNFNESAVLESTVSLNFELADNPDEVAGFALIDSASLNNSGSSLSNILPTRNGLMIYKVQAGDNLSKIAANFSISLDTIFWANPSLSKKNVLRTGQEIVVLPISGVAHQVKDGETIYSIASRYSISPQTILDFNSKIEAGATIVIPGAKPLSSSFAYEETANLPRLAGFFVLPTTGWNWGRLHYQNAIDIANACNTAIYAAAEGLVLSVSNGWSGGYGNNIVLEHPNGVKTRYAHLHNSAVEEGQYVLQGDLIGYMGNTGLTHGPTGCHLHFEVQGAQNPFAK